MKKLLKSIFLILIFNFPFVTISYASSTDEIISSLAESAPMMFIILLLFIIFVVWMKKATKKIYKKNSFRDELMSYAQGHEKHEYSGNVSVNTNGITYSRGNNSKLFKIPIQKETYLAPFMVDDWFENRNYNHREAEIIIKDISQYLIDNKICKSTHILSDEEYEEMFYESEDVEISDETEEEYEE